MNSITTDNTMPTRGNKTFTFKIFTRYRDLNFVAHHNRFKGKNGKWLRVARKKDGSDTTVLRVAPENWTEEATLYFCGLENKWDKNGLPFSPDYVPPAPKLKKNRGSVKSNDKTNHHKTTVDGGELKPSAHLTMAAPDEYDEDGWKQFVHPMYYGQPLKMNRDSRVFRVQDNKFLGKYNDQNGVIEYHIHDIEESDPDDELDDDWLNDDKKVHPHFANTPVKKWHKEIALARNNIRDHPEEENTVYKFMTEEEWNNAHWNEGEGLNLPYNCKNKYLQLTNTTPKGKLLWLQDTLTNINIKYNLKFCRVPSTHTLPDEIPEYGVDWIMEEDPDLVVPPNHHEIPWIPHRICGAVIIGVMVPEGYDFDDFNLRKLGDKITHFEQPKTSFEYRGIYGVQT
jgi:hypothetical protein